jgi:hypothetical protein
VIAQDAVIVGRLIQIFDNPFIQLFDVDEAVAVEIGLDVSDNLDEDAPSEG